MSRDAAESSRFRPLVFLIDILRRFADCKPETAFLIIGCVAGTASVILTPPMFGGSLDEHEHFSRSYQVTDLVFTPIEDEGGGELRGASLPKSFRKLPSISFGAWPGPSETGLDASSILREFSTPLDKSEKEFFRFQGSNSYPFFTFLPAAVGIAAGKFASLPWVALMYLGRLSSLTVWILVMYWAIRKTRRFGLLLMVMALSPFSLYLGSGISGDTMTNAFAFLLFGCVLNAAYDRENVVSRGALMLLCAVAAAVLVGKQGYVTLVALPLLIPPKRFGSTKRYLGFFAAYFLIQGLIFTAVFFHITSMYKYGGLSAGPSGGLMSNAEYIVNNPLAYGRTVLSTITFNTIPQDGHLIFHNWIQTFIMLDGSLLFRLPLWFAIFHYGVYYAASSSCVSQERSVTIWQRAFLMCVFVAGVLVMLTSCYLGWSSPEAETIGGVQARYFIPLAPLAFIPIAARFRVGRVSPRMARIGAYSFVLVSLLVTQIFLTRFIYGAKDNLIPNGNFALWLSGDDLPLGWSMQDHDDNASITLSGDALPPGWSIDITDMFTLDKGIKKIDNENFSGGVGVEQTWTKGDGYTELRHLFGTTVFGLSPRKWHHLYIRSKSPKQGVRVALDELYGDTLQRNTDVVNGWHPWNRTRFFSSESGVVRIGAWCPSATIENPVVIEWDEWVLVELP